jgi:nitrogen fixation/metabolism regulation signal transduction histidine kinase
MTQATEQAQAPAKPPSAAANYSGKRQLRNFLLDRMQLRYAAVIVVICASLTSVLGLWLGHEVYNKVHEATDTARVTVLQTVDDQGVRDQIIHEFAEKDHELLMSLVYRLVLGGLALCFALALYGIVITHKVAGPLYKIATYFTKMKDGSLGPVYNLRKGDQLQEFFEQFKTMHDALRHRAEEELAVLNQVVPALQATKPTGEAATQLEALESLRRKKEESLV